MDIKLQLAKQIKIEGKTAQEIKDMITITPNLEMGDLALPCFTFAKIKRMAPALIAKEIAESLEGSDLIEKTQVVGGYLNFFLNRQYVAKNVLESFEAENFYVDKISSKQKVCLEYGSPNLAKFMHIGHYNCILYGEAVAKLYEFFGYDVVRINYVGDYGTPFGKMVVAYQKWGNKQLIQQKGVDAIQELYIKFNQEENDELMEEARAASKKIEEKSGEEYQIYKWFIEISVQKAKDIIDMLGITFDDWRGESTYNDKLKAITEGLLEENIAKRSEGAVIVDLTDQGKGVSVIQRSDGASLYITRDLAAIQDRFEKYNFDKHIYFTANQQNLHFEKLISICKLMGREYADKLQHVSYGLFSTSEGKISSRKGKQALLEDILNDAKEKAEEIIATRTFKKLDKNTVAQEIAKGAMAFSIFKVEANKDKVFDLQAAISFEGDTSPYLQYTYARCASLINKSTAEQKQVDYSVYENAEAYSILKAVADFKQVIKLSFNQNEPMYIARALLDIARLFNSYYAENTFLKTQDEFEKVILAKLVSKTLKTGLGLLCINTLEEM